MSLAKIAEKLKKVVGGWVCAVGSKSGFIDCSQQENKFEKFKF
jgi:hypothetical protein